MLFAALLFDPHRTPTRVANHQHKGSVVLIDESQEMTPGQIHRLDHAFNAFRFRIRRTEHGDLMESIYK